MVEHALRMPSAWWTRLVWSLLWCVAIAGLSAGAHAAQAVNDAMLDEHVNRLASELRCLVCQNQTVADSQAPLALQLKQVVREQLARGASDQQVRDFMVQRYGDFVLYRPPVGASTALLWGGPVLLLMLGVGLLGSHWRARRLDGDAPDDMPEEADDERPHP